MGARLTLLEAVNIVLSSVGEAPVNSITNGGASAEIAETIIGEVQREILMKGWQWNTDYNVKLNRDVNGFIYLPENALKFTDYEDNLILGNLVFRGDRIYDRYNKTFVFQQDVTVDLVIYLDFMDLPEEAKRYVTIKSSRLFQQRFLGSTTLNSYQEQEEVIAHAKMLEAEINYQNANFLYGSNDSARILNRFDSEFSYSTRRR